MAVKKYAGEEAVGRIADYVNRKLTVVSSMPSSPTELMVVLYVGPTTEDYSQGGIYIYANGEWYLISSVDVHVLTGYYFEGAFYMDEEHTTEMSAVSGHLYIDLPNNDLYLYDEANTEYVLAGGAEYAGGYGINIDGTTISAKTFVGTKQEWNALVPADQAKYDTVCFVNDNGHSEEIEVAYVDELPTVNIQDVIYGLLSYNYSSATIADGFLDNVSLFTKTAESSTEYVYTASNVEVSTDDIIYKDFNSLEYDGTDFILTTDDIDTETLTIGDKFYWRVKSGKTYYAGCTADNTVTQISGGGGSAIRVVTTDPRLIGTTVTITGGVFEATGVFQQSDGAALVEGVLEVGDLSIILNDGERIKTYQLNVPYYSFYEINVMMGFDYEKWVIAGGEDPSGYSSLEDVFADEEMVRELMMKHSSVDYLVFAFNDNLVELDAFTENETAMTYLGLSNYAADRIRTVSGAKAKLLASPYWKKYCKDDVPKMTIASEPYCTISASSYLTSSQYGTFYPYLAFDKIMTDGSSSSDVHRWICNSAVVDQWIQCLFPLPICVDKVEISCEFYTAGNRIHNFKIQGSNDGTAFEDIYTGVFPDATERGVTTEVFTMNNENYFLYYRLYVIDSYDGSIEANEIQFYGRYLDKHVPVMTSATAPYGEATATSYYDNTYLPYKAFDGNDSTFWCSSTLGSATNLRLTYKFETAIKPRFAKLKFETGNIISEQTYKIQGSNNGTTWVDLTGLRTDIPNNDIIELNASDGYKYLSILIVSQILSVNYACGRIYTLQYYGVDVDEHEFAETPNSIKLIGDNTIFTDSFADTFDTYTDGNTTQILNASKDYVVGNPQYYGCTGLMTTKVPMDLTDYSKVIISAEGRTKDASGSRNWIVGFTNNKVSTYSQSGISWAANVAIVSNNTTMSKRYAFIDVSNVNGDKYFVICGIYNHGIAWNIELIK